MVTPVVAIRRLVPSNLLGRQNIHTHTSRRQKSWLVSQQIRTATQSHISTFTPALSTDSDYRVAIHTDVSDVEIYNDSDELVAIVPDLRKAFILIKAIYAASRHTWTTKQLDRERRIAFRHGVTITPGMSLDEHELDFLPPRSIVEVDGWVLQRTIRGWVTQRGNKTTAPTYGVFMGIIDRYSEAPFEEYDNDDDDDACDTGRPYGFEDCCE